MSKETTLLGLFDINKVGANIPAEERLDVIGKVAGLCFDATKDKAEQITTTEQIQLFEKVRDTQVIPEHLLERYWESRDIQVDVTEDGVNEAAYLMTHMVIQEMVQASLSNPNVFTDGLEDFFLDRKDLTYIQSLVWIVDGRTFHSSEEFFNHLMAYAESGI